MVDGRGMLVLQDLLDNGFEVEASEEAARRQVERAAREARSFASTFAKPTSPNITGVHEDATFLFVFVRGTGAEEWQDPQGGIMYTVRAVHNAFYNRRTVPGITHVGYHLAIDNHNIATHNIVAWDPKRDVVRRLTNVTGLRVEY